MADANKNWNNKGNENPSDLGKAGGAPLSGGQHAGNQHGQHAAGGQTSGGQSTASTLADMASQGREKVRDAANAASEGIGHAAEKVQRWAQDAYGVSSEQVGEAADKVQQWAGDAYGYTADHMKDFGQELTSFVRRNPVPALLIGFGVGMLLGRASRA